MMMEWWGDRGVAERPQWTLKVAILRNDHLKNKIAKFKKKYIIITRNASNSRTLSLDCFYQIPADRLSRHFVCHRASLLLMITEHFIRLIRLLMGNVIKSSLGACSFSIIIIFSIEYLSRKLVHVLHGNAKICF